MHERRKHIRLSLEEITAQLIDKSDGSETEYYPMNVSERGFSIITRRYIPENSKFILRLDLHDVELVARWCKTKEDVVALFRVGLEMVTPGDLTAMIKEELTVE